MNCELCNNEHDGSFGSGRFCSLKCSKSYSTSLDRKNISKKVSKKLSNKLFTFVCTNCNKSFENGLFRSGRNIHCTECRKKRIVKSIDEINSIFELSSRTITKILKRLHLGCVICGWDKTTLDLHHIIPRKKGGTDDHSNLVALCPNCHRLAHENKISVEELITRSLVQKIPNWKDYYNYR